MDSSCDRTLSALASMASSMHTAGSSQLTPAAYQQAFNLAIPQPTLEHSFRLCCDLEAVRSLGQGVHADGGQQVPSPSVRARKVPALTFPPCPSGLSGAARRPPGSTGSTLPAATSKARGVTARSCTLNCAPQPPLSSSSPAWEVPRAGRILALYCRQVHPVCPVRYPPD